MQSTDLISGGYTSPASIQDGIVTLECGTAIDLLVIQATCNKAFQALGDPEYARAANELFKITGMPLDSGDVRADPVQKA